MHRIRRIILTAALAATALLVIAGAASARRLAFDDQDFELKWTPLSLIMGGTTTTCNVTLLGSFHSLTIQKVLNSLVGYIDHASVNSCNTGAGATFLTATLPWHLTYGGFIGTLPNITRVSLNILGASMQVDPAGALPACLMRTDVAEPWVLIANISSGTGQVGPSMADPTRSIDLEDDRFLCSIGGDAEFEGSALVEDLSGNLLFIRLVA